MMEAEDERVRWANHYSSVHGILLVGEGDFSFSLSLANAFGSASNIVATSLDQHAILVKKYKKAKSNLQTLEKMGATILHGIDATKLKLHPDLTMRKFDRIVFNFPHAGFRGKEDQLHMINLHRELVQGFFRNASHMLRPYGEVHVSHKTSSPFHKWNLEELASKNSLLLIECADFRIKDYPGYKNKRGDGARCDRPFPLGECSTFKFRIGDVHKKMKARKMKVGEVCIRSSIQKPEGKHMLECITRNHQPLVIGDPRANYMGRSPTDFEINVEGIQGSFHSSSRIGFSSQYLRGPQDYVVDSHGMLGSFGPDYSSGVQGCIGNGYDMSTNEAPCRCVHCYRRSLEELYRRRV